MASKCDKCEKVQALQLKIERLKLKLQRLQEGEPIQKMHFCLDGVYTACGIDLFERDADVTEDIKQVTCGNCLKRWNNLKKSWDKELEEDERNGRIDI